MEEAKERKIMKLLLKVKNGTPPQRKSALRQLTDKAREFGAGPLFNQILPLLMSPTLEDQERHLLVKVRLLCVPNPLLITHAPSGLPPFSTRARGTARCSLAWARPVKLARILGCRLTEPCLELAALLQCMDVWVLTQVMHAGD